MYNAFSTIRVEFLEARGTSSMEVVAKFDEQVVPPKKSNNSCMITF